MDREANGVTYPTKKLGPNLLNSLKVAIDNPKWLKLDTFTKELLKEHLDKFEQVPNENIWNSILEIMNSTAQSKGFSVYFFDCRVKQDIFPAHIKPICQEWKDRISAALQNRPHQLIAYPKALDPESLEKLTNAICYASQVQYVTKEARAQARQACILFNTTPSQAMWQEFIKKLTMHVGYKAHILSGLNHLARNEPEGSVAQDLFSQWAEKVSATRKEDPSPALAISQEIVEINRPLKAAEAYLGIPQEILKNWGAEVAMYQAWGTEHKD